MMKPKEFHNISGVMVVSHGEEPFLTTAIENIHPHVNELVIVSNNAGQEITDIIKDFPDPAKIIRLVSIPFFDKMNFSIGAIKNFACQIAKGYWHLVLDPDETIEDKFYKQFHSMIDNDKCFDVVALPRKNYLDGKLTTAYPDWQLRFRRAFCVYAYGVHHELVGWKNRIDLPTQDIEDGFHIIHRKTKTRQIAQDQLYKSMTSRFNNRVRQNWEH